MAELDLSDPSIALALGDIINQMVADQLDKLRPLPRIAIVDTIDAANFKATVHFADDSTATSVPVAMNMIQPTRVGQYVRVEGIEGDKYITDVIGGGLVLSGLVPGDCFATFAGTVGDPFALCRGQTLTGAQTHYPDLWSNIDSAFKSGSNIVLPDCRGRVLMGVDNMGGSDAGRLTSANTLGTAVGAETVTLVANNIPAHLHPITDATHAHGPPTKGSMTDRTGGTANDAGAYVVTGDDAGQGWYSQGTSDGGALSTLTGTAYTGITTTGNQTTTGAAVDKMQPSITANLKIYLGMYVA